MIHTTIPISCWLVTCSLYMITPTMTNAIARQMFAIRDAELTLAPARYRKIYPSSRPTMQIPRAMLAQFNLDKFQCGVCNISIVKEETAVMAAAVMYVISNDPKAFAFEGVDLVQILYIVFEVTIKIKGQIIFHIINN